MLDYKLALKSIRKEEFRGNNPIPDLLSFLHVDKLYGNELNSKISSYYEKIYKDPRSIRPLLRIDVPKSNFTIRPMSRPHLEEWLILEAIVKFISNEIYENNNELCLRSYSTLSFKKELKKSTSAWLMFDERARDFYKAGYKTAVITDITAYYENISLEELRNRLHNFISENKEINNCIDVLFKLFRRWSQDRIANYSLPQGPFAASFFGDIFLDHVDRKMEKYEGYFRYMDDIRIFCKNELEAKIALKDLIIALRDLKLNINAKKTDILVNEQIEDRLFDKHHELMSFIDETIESKNYKLISTEVAYSLQMLFDISFKDDPFERRHLNFSLYRLGILYNSGIDINHDLIINKILTNFDSKPHHTSLFCDFLINFPQRKDIFVSILDFIKSEKNIYEWQEMKLLQCILNFNITLSDNEKSVFYDCGKDRNRHPFVNCFYILLSGKYGKNRDRELLIDIYDEKDNEYIKMAIILSVQELALPSRNTFYNRLKKIESENICNFIEYIKSLKGPLYCLKANKPSIELFEKVEISEYP